MALRRQGNKKKTYVVFKGRQPGIYSSWVECRQQVNGFAGCLFKSYSSMEEVETEWLRYWGMLYVRDVAPEAEHGNPPVEKWREEPVDVIMVEGGVMRRPPRSNMLTWLLIGTLFLTLTMLIISSVLAL